MLFQSTKDSFSNDNADLVAGFLKAIDAWASEYSGKGADVFQTGNMRITFEKSIEFDLTFASCTDLSQPVKNDKERLETIKYAFIHQFWDAFTSDKRAQLTREDHDKFSALLEAL